MQKFVVGLFHFALFTVPLFFMFRTDELFEFNKMILTYGLTTVIVAGWLALMIQQKKIIFRKTPFDVPIFLFLLSQIVSTIFSMHPRTSWLGYYSRFHGGLLSWLSYTSLYYAFVSVVPKKAVRPLLFSAILSSLLVSIYAIFEHFGHSTSCLIISGGKSFGVDCWVQKVQERVFATFGQPNWLAAYLITLLPVTIVTAIETKTGKNGNWQRWFLAVAAVLQFAALLFTRSRSGFLGLVVGLVILVALWGVSSFKNKDKAKNQRNLVITIFLALIATTAWFGTPFTGSISSLWSKQNQAPAAQNTQAAVNRLEEGGTDSGEIRKIVWQGTIDIWKRYPIFGSGPETFAYSYYQDRPSEHNLVSEWDFLYNKAHNEFLNFLATTGIVGFGTYVLLLTSAFWIGFKIIFSKQKYEKKILTASLISGIAAQSVSNFFGFSTVMVTILLFLYFGIIAKIYHDNNDEDEEAALKEVKEISPWQYGAFTLTALLAMFLLARIFVYWSADVDYSQGKDLIRSGRTEAGVASIASAIDKSPSEALFYDELSSIYASAAVQFAQAGEATASAQTASTAVALSDTTLALNPVHLNFYKTRARVFITLAEIDGVLLTEAENTLLAAIDRSPTDAKLWFNLGVVQNGLGKLADAQENLEKAIDFKPDYGAARIQLGQVYEQNQDYDRALEQYQFVLSNLNPNDERALQAVEKISTMSAKPQ